MDIRNWSENKGLASVDINTGLGTGLYSFGSDFQFADMNTGHDECDSIEFVAAGG